MKVHQEQDEQRLIAKHIDTSWERADARLKRVSVSVWSSIGYLRAFDGNSERVREAFALSPEEMTRPSPTISRTNRSLRRACS
jgi:hypothetical protein